MSTISSSTTSTTAYKVTADTTGTLVIQTGATPTTAVTVDASQNVGIGTSSPDYKLTIQNGDAAISLKDTGGTTRAYIGVNGTFGTAPTGALRLRSDQGGFVYGYQGAEQMRIDSSGNVGIGTSSPAAKLDVAGTFRTSDVTNLYGTASSLRGINFGSNEIAWAQGTTSCFLNLSSATGNSGASYNLVIRGLNSNGSVAATLSYITLDATSLYFTGSGGSSQMFPCRAWVNFNGTGTVAIRSSGNVSSITDNGVGSYAVNLTNAMPDTNYACVMATKGSSGAGTPFLPLEHASLAARTTSSIAFYVIALNGATPDADVVEVVFFR